MGQLASVGFRRGASVVGATGSAIVGAVSAILVALASSPPEIAFAVLVGLFFLSLFIVNVRRFLAHGPALSFSGSGIDDPLRIFGFGHVDWADVDRIDLTSSSLEIRLRAPRRAFVLVVPVPLLGRRRQMFKVPLFLLAEPRAAVEAFDRFAPSAQAT
jgi:hypothetical protein